MADLMRNDSTEIGDWAELKGLARCQILVIWIAVTGTRVAEDRQRDSPLISRVNPDSIQRYTMSELMLSRGLAA
jgi:hypothetical protein